MCRGKDQALKVKDQEIALLKQFLSLKEAHIAALSTELQGKDKMLQVKPEMVRGY